VATYDLGASTTPIAFGKEVLICYGDGGPIAKSCHNGLTVEHIMLQGFVGPGTAAVTAMHMTFFPNLAARCERDDQHNLRVSGTEVANVTVRLLMSRRG
jgi:hypothetical protein